MVRCATEVIVLLTWLGLALAAPNPAPLSTPHVPTVLGISTTTYVSTALFHEGVGHGGACLAVGGKVTGISLANAGCEGITPAQERWVDAGGILGNGVGALATGLPLLLRPPRRGPGHYALWLHTIVNLQQAGGYLMVGPWLPVGDWGTGGVLEGVERPLGWQIGLSALGIGITGATIPLAHHLGKPLFGDDMKAAQRRRRWLTWTPYFVGSSLIVGSSLLNRAGPEFAASAAVANFAGTLFLAYLPIFFAEDAFVPAPKYGRRPLEIERRTGWMVAGAVVAVAAVTVLGPGIGRYPEPHPFLGR